MRTPRVSITTDDSDTAVFGSSHTPPASDQHASPNHSNRATMDFNSIDLKSLVGSQNMKSSYSDSVEAVQDPRWAPRVSGYNNRIEVRDHSNELTEEHLKNKRSTVEVANKARKVLRTNQTQTHSVALPTQKSEPSMDDVYEAPISLLTEEDEARLVLSLFQHRDFKALEAVAKLLNESHYVATGSTVDVKTKNTFATPGLEDQKVKQPETKMWSMASMKDRSKNPDTVLADPKFDHAGDPSTQFSSIDKPYSIDRPHSSDRPYSSDMSYSIDNIRYNLSYEGATSSLDYPDEASISTAADTIVLECRSCGNIFGKAAADWCPECGEASGLHSYQASTGNVSESEKESGQYDWGAPSDCYDASERVSDLQNEVDKPVTNDNAANGKHIAEESTPNGQSALMEAFATLGLEDYSSVDFPTLQRRLAAEIHDDPNADADLIIGSTKAFITISTHQDKHNCWELRRTWTALLDQKLMELKDRKPNAPWVSVAEDMGTDVVDCKERFRAIKPKDWQPKSANKIMAGDSGQNNKKIDETSPVRAPTPELFWGPPVRPTLDDNRYTDSLFSKSTYWGCMDRENLPEANGWATAGSYSPCMWNTPAAEDLVDSRWGNRDSSIPKPKTQTPATYTVTYWATIESGNQVIHIPIDSDNVSGPEKTIVDGESCGMKKVWKWIQEKGLNDKVGLQDAFDLARDIYGEVEKKAVDHKEEDNVEHTSEAGLDGWGLPLPHTTTSSAPAAPRGCHHGFFCNCQD